MICILLGRCADRRHTNAKLIPEITSVTGNTEDRVDVTLANGGIHPYDLVLGCDGIHSRVRRLCFGNEAQFLHSLQRYFSIYRDEAHQRAIVLFRQAVPGAHA